MRIRTRAGAWGWVSSALVAGDGFRLCLSRADHQTQSRLTSAPCAVVVARVQHYVSEVTIVSPTTFKFRGHTIWGVRRGEGWGW